MANILLVVPDSDLKASLGFLLRSEGHTISFRPNLFEGPTPMDFDCTVLDMEGAGANIVQAKTFCRVFFPLILLAVAEDDPLSTYAFRTLVKPLLGSTVSEAVRQALESRHLNVV